MRESCVSVTPDYLIYLNIHYIYKKAKVRNYSHKIRPSFNLKNCQLLNKNELVIFTP